MSVESIPGEGGDRGFGAEDEGCAAGAAVVVWELDAVDVCFEDGGRGVGEGGEVVLDFGCGDVFAFPAVCVAYALDVSEQITNISHFNPREIFCVEN